MIFQNSIAANKSSPNFEKISNSIVTVRSRENLANNQFMEKIGAGTPIKESGFIITNYHVVSNAKDIFIKAENKEYQAKVVKTDTKNDLAILKASGLNIDPPALGSNSDIKLGEKVYTLGKPFITSNSFTLTSGIISSTPINLPRGSPKLLQTDAVINPGNSGGPLINQNGKVIAITTAYLSTGDNVAGIGFAIPIDTVKDFIESAT